MNVHQIKHLPKIKHYWQLNVSNLSNVGDEGKYCTDELFSVVIAQYPPAASYDWREDPKAGAEGLCHASYYFNNIYDLDEFKQVLYNQFRLKANSTGNIQAKTEQLTAVQFDYWRKQIEVDAYLAYTFRNLEVADGEETRICQDASELSYIEFVEQFVILPENLRTALFYAAQSTKFDTMYFTELFRPFIPALKLYVYDSSTWELVTLHEHYVDYLAHYAALND